MDSKYLKGIPFAAIQAAAKDETCSKCGRIAVAKLSELTLKKMNLTECCGVPFAGSVGAATLLPHANQPPKAAPERVITMQDFVRKYGTRGASLIIKAMATRTRNIEVGSPLWDTVVELYQDLEAACSSFLLENKP